MDFGLWYQVTEDYVVSISQMREGFELQTEKGKTLHSRCVALAVGLTNAKYIPENLRHLPSSLVSHSSEHTQFSLFQGKSVLVLGGGQSAWESAVLLHQSGEPEGGMPADKQERP
jgi:thioredoxin reductase